MFAPQIVGGMDGGRAEGWMEMRWRTTMMDERWMERAEGWQILAPQTFFGRRGSGGRDREEEVGREGGDHWGEGIIRGTRGRTTSIAKEIARRLRH